MSRHWLAWAAILLIGTSAAWAADPTPLAPEPETPLFLNYTALSHDGRPGAWIPAEEVGKLNKWQIELRECRDLALLRAREAEIRAELDVLHTERLELWEKRLEIEIERRAIAEEEAELERKRANRAERIGIFYRVAGFLALVGAAFLAS